MELLQLKEKIQQIFDTDIDNLGTALMKAVQDEDVRQFAAFEHAVEGDLTKDWLQMVYQYYFADRKEKMQDYTPKCLAEFLAKLCGDADVIIDMCAGSGALTIQKWNQNKDQKFRLYELDETVFPYLLFNMAVRNIDAKIFRADVLQSEVYEQWEIRKGEKYGRVTCIKPAI